MILVSIIIPVYNEEKTIVTLLQQVLQAKLLPGFSREIIVVNDASTDRTPQLLNKFSCRIRLLTHPDNRGKGAAIRSGLAISRGKYVLIQDADLEYSPRHYPDLLKPIRDYNSRVVYGSRLVQLRFKLFGADKTPMPIHFISNKFLTWLTNILYGDSVTDMETGYKIIDRQLMLSLDLSANRFDIEPEITLKILKRHIPILEVPIAVHPRSYKEGKKIGWKDGISAIITLVKYYFV